MLNVNAPQLKERFDTVDENAGFIYNMYTVFENYLTTYANFTKEEMERIKSLILPSVVSKKQQLRFQHGICRHYTFVCSGCLRTFRVDNDGFEHVLDFAAAKQWATEDGSAYPYAPAPDYIEALEDTQVFQISGEDYKLLLREIPGFEIFHQKITVENKARLIERIYSMVSRPGLDRYRNFKLQYPDMYYYIPLYMIASYLGLARETLSRIRASDR